MKFNDILINSVGINEMRQRFSKSYFNLAKRDFNKIHGKYPSIENAQEVYDLYEKQWRDYYIDKPLREKHNKEKGAPVWRYAIRYHIDVHNALCRWLENKYSAVIVGPYGNTWHEKNAGILMKEMNIESIGAYIVDNYLLDEWKIYIDANHKIMPRYVKNKFVDFSHLAYSGVTDDF